jgi:photosystem II stability/assembly factor-like uncharacterized protein
MMGQVPQRNRLAPLAWLYLCTCGVGLASGNEHTQPQNVATELRAAISASLRHDASLSDVFFVDRLTGWAVGDRGVIWHTNDGGTSWYQQQSGVEFRLGSVFFLDTKQGWAVGGESRPQPQSARGIVLRTNDGGQSWRQVPGLTLPRLTRVNFFDHQRGIALGEASTFAPSGVFVTQDGGQTWQALPIDRAGGWLTGDFLADDAGAVAGNGGRFGTLARRQIIHSPLAAQGLHAYRAMRLVAPTGGWLVGDGGLVMKTTDLGRSWQAPPGELPEFAANQFDFHAVAVHGPHVWVAGSPGTRIFHSDDSGHTWQAFATGQSLPLRALSFVDDKRGWAVGELGTILATDDGGRSWHTQRFKEYPASRRAALLAVFARAQDVPLEAIAEIGVAEGYLTTISLIHSPATDGDDKIGQQTIARWHDALITAGAASTDIAWRFPLPSKDLVHSPADLLEWLNRTNDGRALEWLERHLVRTLRMWRPDVVVTHDVNLDRCESHAAIVAAMILRAVQAAADPASHADMISDAGLDPWKVKKVYSLLPADLRGSDSVPCGRFSPQLGTSLADFVSPARHLLQNQHVASPDMHHFALLHSDVDHSTGPRGLLAGITLSPGSEARRMQLPLPQIDLDDLRRLAAKRRHLKELLSATTANVSWSAQLADLTAQLDANAGGELLYQLADGYRTNGRLDLAADTYYSLARRYPDHPLAEPALLWLVHFYASSEVAHYLSPPSLTNIRQAALDETTPPSVALSRDDRLRRATQLAEYLKTSRAALYAEPAVRFAEVAAQRQLGFGNPAKRYFLTLRTLPENDPWRRCAETETWLATPAEVPPAKPIATCRLVTNRPHLDGKLDESFWQASDRLLLRSSDRVQPPNEPAAELRIAYDQQFLYLAICCDKIPGTQYPSDDRPRPRDAALAQFDRVVLRLDIDRDFTTAFELTIDSRGWPHDACWGDSHWNPTWYVAASSDEATWTIEAAIPFAELVAEPPAARHAWAIAVSRTIPRVGYQSWTGDATEAPSPAQFGILLFE